MKLRAVFATVAFGLGAHQAIASQGGVSDDQIIFAQVAAFEGPAGELGVGLAQGIAAAFDEINAQGGVHGRRLVLEKFNDGYEPDVSVQMVRSIINSNNHIGFIGPVGTPTTKVTQPVTTAANTPLIGPLTGAGFLRNPELANVLNIRATYATEAEAWIEYLVDKQGLDRISILYQDDGFGRVGLAGVEAALDRRDMRLVSSATYMRNTTAIKMAVLNIRKSEPDAVVMVGAYRPIAEFIKLSKKLDFNPTFMNISFVGSDSLRDELGEDGEGVLISQVVPFPWDRSNPVVSRYQRALKNAREGGEVGFLSFEGYLVGRVAIEAAKAAGIQIDRQKFVNEFRRLGRVDLDGLRLRYGPGDNQGLDKVYMTRITAEETFEPVALSAASEN